MFLAADKTRLQDLDEALRRYVAWQSILDDKEVLDLSPFQVKQAETQRASADSAVTARLPETHQWILWPEQKTPQSPIEWGVTKLSGSDALAVRALRKLKNDELFVASLGATILRKHLDEVPLWRGEHVPVRQLVEDFARYLYRPRLAGPEVLAKAIRDGLALLTWESDAFAYAESHDGSAGRYRGLRTGQSITIDASDAGVLVKPSIARAQLETEVPAAGGAAPSAPAAASSSGAPPGPSAVGHPSNPTGFRPPATVLRRFHGTVRLDPARVGRDAGRIAEEIIAHLAGQPDAKVEVTLEIEVALPHGASEQTVRTVTENSRSLKFTTQGFEEE